MGILKAKAIISPNHENVWDLETEYAMKKKIIMGKGNGKLVENHFLQEREKSPFFLVVANFSGIWEMTRIIEKVISLAIWDPNGSQKNWNAQVWYFSFEKYILCLENKFIHCKLKYILLLSTG